MENKEDLEEELKINEEKAIDLLVDFIKKKVKEAGVNGVVIGLSGGLDSTVVSFVSAKALDEEDVFCVFLPEEGITKSENGEDAKKVANSLDVKFEKKEISSLIRNFKKHISLNGGKMALANLKARIRMNILYYYANALDYLVLGTSNKSELDCGYFTKYGDGAADVLPLGSLYKTQVRKIAETLSVPKRIIEKPPTAGLLKNQTDEEELGLSYDKIDKILVGLEKNMSVKKLSKLANIEVSKIKKFKNIKKKTEHKRKMPPYPSI